MKARGCSFVVVNSLLNLHSPQIGRRSLRRDDDSLTKSPSSESMNWLTYRNGLFRLREKRRSNYSRHAECGRRVSKLARTTGSFLEGKRAPTNLSHPKSKPGPEEGATQRPAPETVAHTVATSERLPWRSAEPG